MAPDDHPWEYAETSSADPPPGPGWLWVGLYGEVNRWKRRKAEKEPA